MNVTVYLPDDLHQRAVELELLPEPQGPRTGRRGMHLNLSRLLRDALESEVLHAEAVRRRRAVASHAH